MGGRNDLYCLVVLLILYDSTSLLESQYCDEGKPGDLREGNFGQSGAFPWLGVLRVHLHEGDSLKIALTGIVLIKKKYALANAADVAKVPRMVLREDSKAMFIPIADEPWYSALEDYLTHPEYDYKTVNTIAILELKLEFDDRVPFLPICWPRYSFNTSNQLYVIGMTDENKLIEKQIFKMQYVKQKNCDEFYVRAGLVQNKMQPLHMQCAFAEHAESDCVWDTGMVMASNATGQWTMIGFGIRGPGCAAPARFIDISPYMIWIQSATDLDQISNYRRSGRSDERVVEVPIQKTFYLWQRPVSRSDTSGIITHPYRIDAETQRYFIVHRLDKDAININIFGEMYEKTPKACDSYKVLIYRDRTRIVTPSNMGEGAYRITLNDMLMMGYTCVTVKVESLTREKARLWWMTYIDKDEGIAFNDHVETPQDLVKIIAVKPRMKKLKKVERTSKWTPPVTLEAEPIKDDRTYTGISNINLLVKFKYNKEVVLHVSFYGVPNPIIYRANTISQETRRVDTGNDDDYISIYYTSTNNSKIEQDEIKKVDTVTKEAQNRVDTDYDDGNRSTYYDTSTNKSEIEKDENEKISSIQNEFNYSIRNELNDSQAESNSINLENQDDSFDLMVGPIETGGSSDLNFDSSVPVIRRLSDTKYRLRKQKAMQRRAERIKIDKNAYKTIHLDKTY